MRSLFITATGTNVGKTHTTLKLIEALAKKGVKPGIYKPIETGVSDIPHDAALLLEACKKANPAYRALTTKEITAYTFELPAAPFCADSRQTIDLKSIMDIHNRLLTKCDILLIEGAGGLMVPITETYMMVHLIKEFATKALLVTPSRLGCINDTLLSMMALKSFDIDFEWCVNLHEDREDFKLVTQPYYDTVFPQWKSAEEAVEKIVSSIVSPSA
jgi:dethiobiotin synthetase